MIEPSLPPIPQSNATNDKLLIILCHLSLIIGVGLILPLIIYLVKRAESSLVAAHAGEVINFHISLFIYGMCCLPLVLILIGIPLLIGLGLLSFICAIVGAIRASEGVFYRYPMTIRFIS